METYAGQPISYIAMGSQRHGGDPGRNGQDAGAITGLTAVLAGGDVVLNWPAVTQATDGSALGALVYRVYARAHDPNFVPTPADRVGEVTGTTFTHVSGADPALHYSYVLTAIGNNCWKFESALSNRVTVNHPPVANAQSHGDGREHGPRGDADRDGRRTVIALTFRVTNGPSPRRVERHGAESDLHAGGGLHRVPTASPMWPTMARWTPRRRRSVSLSLGTAAITLAISAQPRHCPRRAYFL